MVNKNTINNLINHTYINEVFFYHYNSCKNNIYNTSKYLILFDKNTITDFNFGVILHEYYSNNQITDNFDKDIETFFKIKKEICVKEKKLRKQKNLIKIFTNHHKICNDIQNLILSFLI